MIEKKQSERKSKLEQQRVREFRQAGMALVNRELNARELRMRNEERQILANHRMQVILQQESDARLAHHEEKALREIRQRAKRELDLQDRRSDRTYLHKIKHELAVQHTKQVEQERRVQVEQKLEEEESRLKELVEKRAQLRQRFLDEKYRIEREKAGLKPNDGQIRSSQPLLLCDIASPSKASPRSETNLRGEGRRIMIHSARQPPHSPNHYLQPLSRQYPDETYSDVQRHRSPTRHLEQQHALQRVDQQPRKHIDFESSLNELRRHESQGDSSNERFNQTPLMSFDEDWDLEEAKSPYHGATALALYEPVVQSHQTYNYPGHNLQSNTSSNNNSFLTHAYVEPSGGLLNLDDRQRPNLGMHFPASYHGSSSNSHYPQGLQIRTPPDNTFSQQPNPILGQNYHLSKQAPAYQSSVRQDPRLRSNYVPQDQMRGDRQILPSQSFIPIEKQTKLQQHQQPMQPIFSEFASQQRQDYLPDGSRQIPIRQEHQRLQDGSNTSGSQSQHFQTSPIYSHSYQSQQGFSGTSGNPQKPEQHVISKTSRYNAHMEPSTFTASTSSTSEPHQKLQGRTADAGPNEWFYMDAQGQLQGPFSDQRMRTWNERGLLPQDLPIQANGSDADNFIPLDQLFTDPTLAFQCSTDNDDIPSS